MSETAIHLERLIARRVRGVEAAARREILICIVAALFFAAVVAWRFGYVPWVALVWSAAALYRFRREIWRPAAGEMAVTGLAHYRAVLAGRRDLLRQAWLWQGPLLLSCGTLAVVALGQAPGGLARWRNMAPFLTLLALWVVLAMVLRRREAAELQREIDELGPGGA